MVNAAVVGARGYLGRELVRLLSRHPDIQRVVPISSTVEGELLSKHDARFTGSTLRFGGKQEAVACDALFLATPDQAARELVAEFGNGQVVVDLSRAHREDALNGGDWQYGQPELNPVAQGCRRIANPGCYPTATALAMGPALAAGIVGDGPIIVDGKSGVSGAGVNPRQDLHFPEMNEHTRAYKVTGHDHVTEMRDFARRLDKGGRDHVVRFTPHLVPQTRGLLATVYLPHNGEGDVPAIYEEHYQDMPFVHVVDEADTGAVAGTNHAHVAVDVDEEAGLLVVRAAIDNLLKGGSGTAVQNLNHALGIEPETGLVHA